VEEYGMFIIIIGVIFVIFHRQFTKYCIESRVKQGFAKSAKWMKEHEEWYNKFVLLFGVLLIIAGILISLGIPLKERSQEKKFNCFRPHNQHVF
jgi:hypothetical protein